MSFFNVCRFALYSLFLLITEVSFAQFSAMSFNIRLDTDADGENAWNKRKEEVAGFLSRFNPDFLGIQEGMYQQVTFLKDKLPAYDFIGKGRDDGDKKGEFSCILYKKEKWTPLENNTFWLSPTPEKVSKGWDAALERIFTYGVFFHQTTGDTVFVINTHFDHMGQEARKQSAVLILNFIKTKNLGVKKLVVMGDLNSRPTDEPVMTFKQFLTDSYDVVSHADTDPVATFNGFDTVRKPSDRIDYILFRNLKLKSCQIIPERRKNNLYLSDHFPVWAEFTF